MRYVHAMLELGLTGGIGSGKSTVAQLLVDRGAALIDADLIVRELQSPGGEVFAAMVERWGDKIVGVDGNLNRPAVAEIVFNDPDELTELNNIVHPPVITEMARLREELAKTDKVVINDIPLLVKKEGEEANHDYDHLKGIIVVDLPTEIAVERLVAFRGFDKADAEARMANQASREDRLAVADFVIDNAGLVEDLEPQIDKCWAWIASLR